MKIQPIKIALLTTAIIALTLSHQAPAETSPNTFKAPLELQKIMLKMGMEMHKISEAISTDDWAQVKKSANWIADHPTPSIGERMKIMAFLGTEAFKFKANNKKTHKAANSVAYAASQKHEPSTNSAFAVLQQTCLACHQTYREKFQSHFYSQD